MRGWRHRRLPGRNVERAGKPRPEDSPTSPSLTHRTRSLVPLGRSIRSVHSVGRSVGRAKVRFVIHTYAVTAALWRRLRCAAKEGKKTMCVTTNERSSRARARACASVCFLSLSSIALCWLWLLLAGRSVCVPTRRDECWWPTSASRASFV
ncbi:hypothetical protein BC567DRAFT_213779 [Phyllosticta citribraziliensis]